MTTEHVDVLIVGVGRTDTGESLQMPGGFVFMCSGYYNYDEPYTPELPGVERFQGTLVHPQLWSEDIDYAGKRVIVIGSGATAVTLVPAMAKDAAQVTMLQRTPSYVVSIPGTDPIARFLRKHLPPRIVWPVVRWKNVLIQAGFFRLARRRPQFVKRLLMRVAERHLPSGFDVGTHFNPPYNPWDQRLCVVPNADLFEGLSDGRASIVTDRIDTVSEKGIKLASA